MLPYRHHTCDMFTRSFGRKNSLTWLLLYRYFLALRGLVGKSPKYRCCNTLTGDLVGRGPNYIWFKILHTLGPNYIWFKILHTLMLVVVDCLTHSLRKVQTRMLWSGWSWSLSCQRVEGQCEPESIHFSSVVCALADSFAKHSVSAVVLKPATLVNHAG